MRSIPRVTDIRRLSNMLRLCSEQISEATTLLRFRANKYESDLRNLDRFKLNQRDAVSLLNKAKTTLDVIAIEHEHLYRDIIKKGKYRRWYKSMQEQIEDQSSEALLIKIRPFRPKVIDVTPHKNALRLTSTGDWLSEPIYDDRLEQLLDERDQYYKERQDNHD